MYQAGVEAIMVFRLLGTTLVIDPCILRAWTGNEIDFRYHSARYEIVVDNPQGVSRGVASIELDGHALAGRGTTIPLVDYGVTHAVRVVLGHRPRRNPDAPVPTPLAAREHGAGLSAVAASGPRRTMSGETVVLRSAR